MLELYHNINSVCAQKVRIALKERGQDAREHLLTLRGDQNEPDYLKLNPNGVVPTLVHDGVPIGESSLVLYYIDEIFPDPMSAQIGPAWNEGIIKTLDLLKPIYHQTARHGHFGRAPGANGAFSWERIDKADALRKAAGIGSPAKKGRTVVAM